VRKGGKMGNQREKNPQRGEREEIGKGKVIFIGGLTAVRAYSYRESGKIGGVYKNWEGHLRKRKGGGSRGKKKRHCRSWGDFL